MKSLLQRSCLLAVLSVPVFAASSLLLHAQELSSVKGGLSGTVTDNTSAVVPEAKLTITGNADTRTVTSDANGRFSAGSLTPGMYKIKVEKEGFKSTEANNVEVVINRSSNVSLVLQPGTVAETVEVSATSVEVDTNSTAIGTNLTSTFYSQVPVARNVGSLFYVAPGAVNGGGTGNSNPSIGGATGLENQYVADGVSINDSGYGGLGVYSPSYGSLGTGINLSFIQEVQVKTGAFEPKYGKANGGVVQIVTKSGGSQYHGALAAYFAPEGMSAQYANADSFRTGAGLGSFQYGHIYSQPSFDASLELGGYIPVKGAHDRFFFFGALNPTLNQVNYVAPNVPFSAALYNDGPYASSITAYNWAGKLTFKLNDGTSIEGSAFGDPSSSNYAYGAAYTSPYGHPNLQQKNQTAFSRWSYGSRSEVVRLNSTVTPTTQLTIAATNKSSHFTESGFDNIYQVTDKTTGSTGFQGLGEFQNPLNHSYGINFDLQKVVNKFGQHTLSIGWGFDRAIYNSNRDYSGPRFSFPTANSAGTPVQQIGGNDALVGTSTSAAFYLANIPGASTCPTLYCPIYDAADGTPHQVYLRQPRGIFSGTQVSSSQGYHAIYGNDNWAINRHVTINAGLRWEEEQLNGPNQQYVFNDNWSPRLGINIDPFGDRKSKVFFNWGRYTQSLPTDAAIRELNQESDVTARWAAPSALGADGEYHLVTNADGTVTPILDAAHLISGEFGIAKVTASAAVPELFHSGTKLNFEEEYVAGIERQFKSFVFSARYTDRRLERIVEDMQGISPEGANAGLPNQVYLIGNPNPGSDYFVNEIEETYDPNGAPPADCVYDYGAQQDSLGNTVGAACGQNPGDYADGVYTPGAAGATTPDGKPDGFATPIRRYQALELEANKSFSNNFLIRANYRFAKLYGNYEGLFRNDNGQSDPGISSLFDFTQGAIGLLGAQFKPGYLNTDRRNVGNLYGSYLIPGSFAKNLTVGLGLRGQTGVPISALASHPVYQNTGEIPIGGRGTAGTTPTSIQLDLHTDYPITVKERAKLKLAFDVFNATNSKFILQKNQNIDTGFQTGADPTNGTPISFQRAFYARGSLRFEF